jgi:DNA-binding NarL/FixJ family response regulator
VGDSRDDLRKKGKMKKEIASELVVSVHTVERHVQNAYGKIGANSLMDARAYVSRIGL